MRSISARSRSQQVCAVGLGIYSKEINNNTIIGVTRSQGKLTGILQMSSSTRGIYGSAVCPRSEGRRQHIRCCHITGVSCCGVTPNTSRTNCFTTCSGCALRVNRGQRRLLCGRSGKVSRWPSVLTRIASRRSDGRWESSAVMTDAPIERDSVALGPPRPALLLPKQRSPTSE